MRLSRRHFVRYGGEEFVAVFPELDPSRALALAEEIRSRVEALGIPHATSPVAPWVTLSLGLYCSPVVTEQPADHWIQRADEALYRSKSAGRNRVTCWEPEALEAASSGLGEG